MHWGIMHFLSSIEIHLHSPNTNVGMARKNVNVSSFESRIYFLKISQQNKNLIFWSSFLNLGSWYQKSSIPKLF